MEWDNGKIVRKHLTMLVVDIRNSSTFFIDTPAEQQSRFLKEFSQKVETAVATVTDGNRAEAYIDKFTGDGFLIFFDEPTPDNVVRFGPARAVATALSIRQRLRSMRRSWPERYTPRPDIEQLGLVAGIVYGDVLFGPLAEPANPEPTAILEPVVKAFRFAQVRDHPHLSQRDAILVCDDSYKLINEFVESDRMNDHSELFADLNGATYNAVQLGRLKGVKDSHCREVIWEGDPQPPNTLTRWLRASGSRWRRLRG